MGDKMFGDICDIGQPQYYKWFLFFDFTRLFCFYVIVTLWFVNVTNVIKYYVTQVLPHISTDIDKLFTNKFLMLTMEDKLTFFISKTNFLSTTPTSLNNTTFDHYDKQKSFFIRACLDQLIYFSELFGVPLFEFYGRKGITVYSKTRLLILQL